MALDVTLIGGPVDANTNVKVALPNTPAQVGSVRLMSENDSGTVTGTPYLRSPETSSDYRLRVGVDTLFFPTHSTLLHKTLITGLIHLLL